MVRLYWLGDVLDSTPIATYTPIFMQIGLLFRKISTDKLFRTHRRTDTHTHVKLKPSFLCVSVLVESGNVLSSTSNFWRYSNTSIRSTNMEVKSVPQCHAFRDHTPRKGCTYSSIPQYILGVMKETRFCYLVWNMWTSRQDILTSQLGLLLFCYLSEMLSFLFPSF